MSDVTTGTTFNPQFFMNPPWWIGRVEEKSVWSDNFRGKTFTNVSEIRGWGHRYKVRIFNWHTGDTDSLKPDEIAMCQVIMPVTAGSGHGGASETPSIESGSIVFGFFMDGMAGQEGYIVGVLGNSNNNVPKERSTPSPNQSKTSVTSGQDGRPVVSKSNPPLSSSGPGSASNQTLPPNVDGLSTNQLKRLLDPSKTPSSEVFRAAAEARQKAKSQGKTAKEIERLVLVATVKASKQPASDAGANANCNKGYQQFNDTYKDGTEEKSAKVPDNLILNGNPLQTTEALHIGVKSTHDLKRDQKVKIPLIDVSKKNNSNTTGIQRSVKNLVNTIEDLKKTYNKVSAFQTDSAEFTEKIEKEISGVVNEISGFTKNIMGGVRSYTYDRLAKEARKASGNLFPSEVPKFYKKVEQSLGFIACAFNKITAKMPGLLNKLLKNLLDKAINIPLCTAENIMSSIMNNVMNSLKNSLSKIFAMLKSSLRSITKLGKKLGGDIGSLFGNIFNALEYVNGIKEFFKCDDEETPVKYTEVSLAGPAIPGGDAIASPTKDGGAPVGTGDPFASAANIVNKIDESNDLDSPTTDNFREAVKAEDSETSGLTLL